MEEKVIEFIQSQIVKDKDIAKINSADNLIETGLIDSLGIQKLIMFLEDTFPIDISDDDLIPDNFETVEAISSFLRTKMG